jgi:hypothetical protein
METLLLLIELHLIGRPKTEKRKKENIKGLYMLYMPFIVAVVECIAVSL